MAVTSSPSARPDDVVDPVIDKLARTNTFDSDWPTLQHHLGLALDAALDSFLTAQSSSSASGLGRGSGFGARSSSPTPPPLGTSDSNSLSLSPTTSRASGAPGGESPSLAQTTRDSPPSTPGGKVIPAFPPLTPRRRGSAGAGAGGNNGTSSGSPSGPSIASVRVNGHPAMPVRGNVFEDEWDEDIMIGGKMLPARMEAEEAKAEVQRLHSLLEEFTYQLQAQLTSSPPFTVQRLAELLSSPTSHTSIGKYLRAIERVLLVTIPWEAPSYVPVPVNAFAVPPSLEASGNGSGSGSGSLGGDIPTAMPPRSTTPMFSPIPFALSPAPSISPADSGVDATAAQRSTAGDRDEEDGLNEPAEIDMGWEQYEEENGALAYYGADGRGSSRGDQDTVGQLNGDAGAAGRTDGVAETDTRVAGVAEDEDVDMDLRENREPAPEPEREGDAPGSAGAPAAAYVDSPRPSARQETLSPSRSTQAAAGALASVTATSGAISHPNDPGHQPYLGRVDELDTGPIDAAGAGGGGVGPAVGSDDAGAGDGSVDLSVGSGGEGGNMTPHGMSERPVPLTSTTSVEPRLTAGLPRSRSASASAGVGAGSSASPGEDEGEAK